MSNWKDAEGPLLLMPCRAAKPQGGTHTPAGTSLTTTVPGLIASSGWVCREGARGTQVGHTLGLKVES